MTFIAVSVAASAALGSSSDALMHTFDCTCGSRLFFENTECLACGTDVGYCPVCRDVTAVAPEGSGSTWRCTAPDCGAVLVPCRNREEEHVCNRYVVPGDAPSDTLPLCASCILTDVIPDLSVNGNREKWYKLEAAKRRLLHQFDTLGLPYGADVAPPLSFDFKADRKVTGRRWRKSDDGKVFTGHANGKITINLVEADDAEREALRVQFGEAHRTLLGHLRHESGHYFWQMLVQDRCEDRCRAVFGDHSNPSYADALDAYYDSGPAADWRDAYVSAYASMHPWEDFAETYALYLEIVTVLDTAAHFGMTSEHEWSATSVSTLVGSYLGIGLMVNELNRSLELPDLVARTIPPPVLTKLAYIHDLLANAAAARGA